VSGPRLARYHAGEDAKLIEAGEVLLFTDLHLAPERPQEAASFAIRLAGLAASSRASLNGQRVVVVMGDLFDSYSGPEDWELPSFHALQESFRALHAAGAAVFLLRGNRDVMLEPGHAADFGAVVTDSLLLKLPGRPLTLVTHGDAFCLADRRYQFLRRTLRQPGLRRFILRRGAGTRRWCARRLRGVSRGELARKPLAHLDVSSPSLEVEMRRCGAQMAVLGHLHENRVLRLADGLRGRILPAWDAEAPAWDLAALLDGRQ
jgi:UDP-2,3-diacylglucosamine hydrolase